MKHTEDFPAVSNHTLSIARLYNLVKENRLPQNFSVGGRIEYRGAELSLVSKQGRVRLLQDKVFGDGDLVVIHGLRDDLTQQEGVLFLSGYEKFEVLVQTLAASTFSDAFTEQTAKRWSQFLFATREFFNNEGLLEVTTPYLVQNPGMEPELEPFATSWQRGSLKKPYFLPTSPELHLKQMLAAGFTDIFEIKTAFRNEELTDSHQPEFNMLEWYRGFSNLSSIEEDLHAYLNYLSSKVFSAGGQLGEIKKYTVAEFFSEGVGFKLEPATSTSELFKLAEKLNLMPSKNLDWNDLYHLIWVSKIEPTLPQSPFLLCDYPTSQAALARINARGWADRFEFYWQGYEIANAFHELNDPNEQRTRFERDQKKRIAYGRTPLEIDEQFMTALKHGLPPSGGIALGLDRLFMAFMGIKKISEARAFTFYY